MSILMNEQKSGNCASFDELYKQYHAAIARRVMCRLAHDTELVEDVLQEVWIAVWQALPDTPYPSAAWLYRIATTKAIDAWRSKYRVQPSRGKGPQPLPLSLDARNENDIPLSETLLDQKFIDPAESEWVDVERSLAQLPAHEQYVLAFRARGYTLREIQGHLGISYRAILDYANKARAHFQHAYQGEESEVA